jgi:hypothetical protein
VACVQKIEAAIGENQLFPLLIQGVAQSPDIGDGGGIVVIGHALLLARSVADARWERFEI